MKVVFSAFHCKAAHERVQERAKEGQVVRRPHGHPPCRSASAPKSKRTDTRASFLAPVSKCGSVGGLSPGSIQRRLFLWCARKRRAFQRLAHFSGVQYSLVRLLLSS